MATSKSTKHIFLAEDDAAISEVVTFVLQDAKYMVTVPRNYEDCIIKLQKEKYDLILLDLMLWGNEGGEIAKRVKSNSETKNTPIILLSARNDAQHIARTIGVDDILEKPFEIEELLKKIEKFCSNK